MKRNTLFWIASTVCLLSVLGMIVALSYANSRNGVAEFVPPPFEGSAQTGMPHVPDESFTKIYRDGMSFSAYVCGEVRVNKTYADLYFTNAAENHVWLKLRILDENDTTIAETGIIKPGEYVKAIYFSRVPDHGSPVRLKIMAYEANTYYSMGAVVLNAKITNNTP